MNGAPRVVMMRALSELEARDCTGKCAFTRCSWVRQFLHTVRRREHPRRMHNARAFSAASATSPLASTVIARRDPTDMDVQIEILFCGICHSDLHQVRNEWSGVMPTVYPCVPGHEIVGRVTKVGKGVKKFKPGDIAAVGCMVDTDRTCPECKAGLEQFCPNMTL